MVILYLALFWLGPVAAVVVAIAAWRAWRRHRIAMLWPAAVALIIEGGALWIGYREAHYWDGWEPISVVDDSAFVGEWRCRAGSFSLRADGSFATPSGEHGRWSRRDLDGAVLANARVLYPFRRNGEIVLFPIRAECTLDSTRACADADTWDRRDVCTRGG